MEKNTFSTTENIPYTIVKRIKNIAIITTDNYKNALINLDTKEILISPKATRFISTFEEQEIFHESGKNKEGKYLTLYDALNEKFIANAWPLIKPLHDFIETDNSAILLNPHTKKFHIFDLSLYRKNQSIFNTPYDDATFLYQNSLHTMYIRICSNNHYGLYAYNEKPRNESPIFIEPTYDSITKINHIIILEKDHKKFFYIIGKESQIYGPFDSVEYNHIDNIVCTSLDDTISAYDISLINPLLFTQKGSSISFIKKYYKYYKIGCPSSTIYFVVEDDHKQSIVKVNTENLSVTSPAISEYDHITFKDNCFYLQRDNKIGFLQVHKKDTYDAEETYIDAIHDNAYPVNDKFAITIDNNLYNILIRDNNTYITLVRNCQSYEFIGDCIKYKKDNLYGLVENNNHHYGFDSIFYDGEKFITKKNRSYGLIIPKVIAIPEKYISVDSHKYGDKIYISLEKEPANFTFNKVENNTLTPLINEPCQSITYFKDFAAIYCPTCVLIFSYQEDKIIKSFNYPVNISELSTNKSTVYLINNFPYYFYNNTLTKVPTLVETYDVTSYTYDFGTIIVSSKDNPNYNEIVASIDSLPEDYVNSILLNNLKKNKTLTKKYHNLLHK